MTIKKLIAKYMWMAKQKYEYVTIETVIADLRNMQLNRSRSRNGDVKEKYE